MKMIVRKGVAARSLTRVVPPLDGCFPSSSAHTKIRETATTIHLGRTGSPE